MVEIIGVRFVSVGRIYFFNPDGGKFQLGDLVLTETSRGQEIGECVVANKMVDEGQIVGQLRKVVRKVTDADRERATTLKDSEADMLKIFAEKIAERGLVMKPVEVQASFDGQKIIFFFSSDGRVDFRDLVKELATIFRTRIELRQIGVRDEAKMIGGLGICGRGICCSGFLSEFQPVSIKMAKDQDLSLNPVKISGTCGRLMCCLKYEQSSYEQLIKETPKKGTVVTFDGGRGVVVDSNLVSGVLKIKPDGDENNFVFVNRREVNKT